jgi:RimJ/RimL family protein N-acetyltransferase
MSAFSIRSLQESDIPLIVSFWERCTPAQLDEMAIDSARVPSGEQWKVHLNKLLETPDTQADACVVVWQADDKAIGFTYASDLVSGETARIQFYLFDAAYLGKGHSKTLVSQSVVELYKRFSLMAILAEVRTTNERANKTLQKIGFPLIKKYSGLAINFGKTVELNRFSIDYQVAKSYLKRNRT